MAFTGPGYRLGSPTLSDTVGSSGPATHELRPAGVPSLKDICLNTLDRYIDLLEDIGTTPYYLIESILRKCNVKQLTRVEYHTEGLNEHTDELWYIHAKNDFKVVREGWPQYDESGEWRSKYHAMKQEDEDKLERKRAQLRQAYSQHDKVKQDRRVIMDPSLRLPKKTIRTGSSSSWSPAPPKKKSLFEKARLEARKITQMYNSNPYPPPRSRINSSSGGTGNSGSTTRQILAPTSVFSQHSTHVAIGSASSRNDSALRAHGAVVNGISSSTNTSASRGGKRYTYKTRPVVYTALSRPTSTSNADEPTSPSTSRASSFHKMPSAPGAIVDFFKELNPAHTSAHTQHTAAASSRHYQGESGTRSPSSPIQPPSKTIQMLREDAGTVSWHQVGTHDRTSGKHGARGRTGDPDARMEDVKINGDYSWLEDDDFDHDGQGTKCTKLEYSRPKKTSTKKPHISVEEAGRQFFDQLIGKPG